MIYLIQIRSAYISFLVSFSCYVWFHSSYILGVFFFPFLVGGGVVESEIADITCHVSRATAALAIVSYNCRLKISCMRLNMSYNCRFKVSAMSLAPRPNSRFSVYCMRSTLCSISRFMVSCVRLTLYSCMMLNLRPNSGFKVPGIRMHLLPSNSWKESSMGLLKKTLYLIKPASAQKE